MTPLRITVAAVRLWTRLYTRRLDPEVRDRRRREIESDLFEQLRTYGNDRWLAARMLVRLLAGVHSDVLWRLETAREPDNSKRVRTIFAAAVMGIVAVLWTAFSTPPNPPDPPVAPKYRSRLELRPYPAPPPPPPPFCSPPGLGRRSEEPCTK
ncbi:MAG TPA: hypothetical protein VJ813_03035 [Vicinamibacterales bacterium]|nr:hypothetical protein [Vicinamibacterales bacterium]